MTKTDILIDNDVVCLWELVIPTDSILCGDEFEGIVTLTEDLYECFGEFFLPTEINLKVHHFPDDAIVPTSEDGDPDKRLSSSEISLQNKYGIEKEALLEALHREQNNSYVSEIPFDSTKVRMQLDGEDVWVDRQNRSRKRSKRGKAARTPSYDPLRCRITHWPNDDDDIESEFAFLVRIDTKTEHWFDNSPDATVNRKRLENFLTEIYESLPVVRVNRDAEYVDKVNMKEIF